MLVGRRIESAGSTEGRAGSNVSVFAMGVVERDAIGVTGWVFALWEAKTKFNHNGLQSRSN